MFRHSLVHIFQFIFFAFLAAYSAYAQQAPDTCDRIEYTFSSQSTLVVQGKTNINTFSCTNERSLPGHNAVVCEGGTSGSLEFQNTILKIPVSNMDCGGKGINNDFRKMMKAHKYPYILLELLDIEPNGLGSNGEKHYKANTLITLVNTRKHVRVPVTLRKNGSNYYAIMGSVHLKLSDFGIEPPRPLMGLIKVEDVIVIEFDLEMGFQA